MAVARHKVRNILMVIALMTAFLSFPSTANASTDYDNITVSGGSLTISYHAQPWTGVTCTSNTIDLANSWKSILLNYSKWDIGGSISSGDAADAIDDFENALTNGSGWGVAQIYNTDAGLNSFGSSLSAYGGEQDTWLEVWWNDTGTASFHSVSPFGPTLMADGNVHTAWIYFSNASGHQCEPRVTQHVLVSSPAVNAAMAIDFTSYPYMHWAPVFLNFDVTYPSGYEGDTPPMSPPHAAYVAMGDSFSSGEGNPPFEMGTDTGYNECHRSPDAYPRLLQADTGLSLGSTAFVACSGATTGSITIGGSGTGGWDEGPQVDALSTDTETVTVTIGGNDVGFQDYLLGCLVTCGPGTLLYSAMMDNIDSTSFLANLETTYESILANASNANVYVIDYPYITASDAESCGAFDFSGGRSIQVALNSTIALAVANVRAESTDYTTRLHYVNTNLSGSPFEGMHLCNGGDSDFGSLTFHPNGAGHEHYKEVIADSIS